MAFSITPLPYDDTALAPAVSAQTLSFHHGKHHQAYIDKTNAAIEGTDLADKSMEEVIAAARGSNQGLFNNSAQSWNHGFYWHSMAADGGSASDELAAMIDEAFGSMDELVKQLQDRGAGHFASGWVWLAEKDGVLERIKNKMREQYPNDDDSAKDAFREFFSQENLTPENYKDKFQFFDTEVMHLMNQNYFRWIGEDGEKKDFFFTIDKWFVLFFLLDFLVRWIVAITQKRYRRWYLFPVRQSYEIFNLFPPHHGAWFRLLRVIPFYMRIRQNGWLPDDGLFPDIIKSNASIIAEEISGLVVLNVLEQAKGSLRRTGLPMEGETRNAVENLLGNQMQSVASKVMPEIEPQISEMVSYSINRAMEPYLLSPIGPIVRLILMSVHATVKDGLEAALSGPEGTERLGRILKASVSEILEDMGDPATQEALIEDVIRVLDRVQEDVRESVANRNART